MSNINDTYFDGYYKEIWRSYIPAELTVKEVDFMVQYFDLHPGSRVLDLMCGYGRHAFELNKRGMDVTAVDNLEDYISEMRARIEKEKLDLKAVKASAIGYEPEGFFDLVISMGNSLCFFNREELQQLFRTLGNHINPGGHFLINTWTIAEIAFNNFRERSWSHVNGLKFITESKHYIQPSRIEYEHLILSPDGKSETKKAIDFIYSISEMENLLAGAGFQLKEVFSIPGRKKFSLGEPRAYLVAERS